MAGVSVPSVSTLELNDQRGVAKTRTVERALAALGLAPWHILLRAERLETLTAQAEAIVAEVDWTMSLEAQHLVYGGP